MPSKEQIEQIQSNKDDNSKIHERLDDICNRLEMLEDKTYVQEVKTYLNEDQNDNQKLTDQNNKAPIYPSTNIDGNASNNSGMKIPDQKVTKRIIEVDKEEIQKKDIADINMEELDTKHLEEQEREEWERIEDMSITQPWVKVTKNENKKNNHNMTTRQNGKRNADGSPNRPTRALRKTIKYL